MVDLLRVFGGLLESVLPPACAACGLVGREPFCRLCPHAVEPAPAFETEAAAEAQAPWADGGPAAAAALAVWLVTSGAWGAPRIDKLSLRGLQAGGITTLVIEGADLLPEPRILFSAPHSKHTIQDGATAKRLEVEVVVDGDDPFRVPAGGGQRRQQRRLGLTLHPGAKLDHHAHQSGDAEAADVE